jgi:cholesterol transport system auxiliary component
MMKRRFLVLAPAGLAGCSILPQQKYIARTDWPLDPAPPMNAVPNPAGKVVLLRALDAGPGMDDEGIKSLRADGSLNTSYYNRWAVAPSDAATQALGEWLTASGDFSAVVAPGSRLSADLILEGELTELVSDLGAAQARAVLTLVVINNAGLTTRPLAQQRITGTAPNAGSDATAEVTAQRAALADALRQAVALVARFS